MRFFRLVVPLEHQHKVVHLDSLAGEHPVDDRRHVRVSLRPDLEVPFTQGRRLLLAKDRRITIVVEKSLLRSPNDVHRLSASEKDVNQRFQGLRSTDWLTERSGSPVERGHHQACLTAAGNKTWLRAGARERAAGSVSFCGKFVDSSGADVSCISDVSKVWTRFSTRKGQSSPRTWH